MTIFTSLISLFTDYSCWVASVTTHRKSSGETLQLKLWTFGYLVLHLAYAIPTIFALKVVGFKQVGIKKLVSVKSCGSRRMNRVLRKDCLKKAASSQYKHDFDFCFEEEDIWKDEDLTQVIAATWFVSLGLRLIAASFIGLYQGYTKSSFGNKTETDEKMPNKRNCIATAGSLKMQPQTRLDIDKMMKKVRKFIVSVVPQIGYYTFRSFFNSLAIYSVIPFAENRIGTLINSILFTFQYAGVTKIIKNEIKCVAKNFPCIFLIFADGIVFMILMFEKAPDLIHYWSGVLHDLKIEGLDRFNVPVAGTELLTNQYHLDEDDMPRDFVPKIKKIVHDTFFDSEAWSVFVYWQVFSSVLLFLLLFLQGVTIYWCFHEDKHGLLTREYDNMSKGLEEDESVEPGSVAKMPSRKPQNCLNSKNLNKMKT